MRKYNLKKNLAAFALVFAMMAMPLATFGQTRLKMPKNDYDISKDVEIGRKNAAEVEQQFPILRDSQADRYIESVGRRLVDGIPREFQHREFRYQFKIVNARDINAFALPAGYMYINRGMIEAAKSEGEMAGVMAHEISHVALRHGTAGASKQNNIGTQLGTIGLILGGAILGGDAGAQLGALGAQAWLTRYSREFETNADILGAQIMANSGYDPRDLANMFKTIEQQSGGNRAPEFLSSHPNPERRYERINQEAELLRVNPSRATQNTRAFQDIQYRLGRLPQAQTMAEIEKNAQNGQGGQQNSTINNGRYSRNVPLPSSRTETYNGGNSLRFSYPNNWEVISQTESSVMIAPNGAYGKDGITHGTLLGATQASNRDLVRATDDYINGLLQAGGNDHLRQTSNPYRTTISRREGIVTVLSGRSPITGRTEVATVYTTELRNGGLFYVITVVPENEASRYNRAFSNMLRSIVIND